MFLSENSEIRDDGSLITKVLIWYLNTSRDVRGEVAFLSALTGLIVIPQVLSFIASGLFGCARQPIFVSTVVKFAILSLMKCFCVFAAIELATALFILCQRSRFDDAELLVVPGNFGMRAGETVTQLLGTEIETTIELSVIFLAYSFGIALFYYLAGRMALFVLTNDPTGLLYWVNNYMTRFSNRGTKLETPSIYSEVLPRD